MYVLYVKHILEIINFPLMWTRSVAALQNEVTKDNVTFIITAALYINLSLCGKDAPDVKDFATSALSEQDLIGWIMKIIIKLKGVLSVPTIYNETENGLECLWYLTECINDCKNIFRDPKDLHYYYWLLEEKYPSLKDFRFSKAMTNIIDISIDKTKKLISVQVEKTFNGKPAIINLTYEKGKFFFLSGKDISSASSSATSTSSSSSLVAPTSISGSPVSFSGSPFYFP